MMINDNANKFDELNGKFETNTIIFDPEELKEGDKILCRSLIHYARLFHNENMHDLANKIMTIAQNYFLSKIFN